MPSRAICARSGTAVGSGNPQLQTWADSRLLRERLAQVRGRGRFQGFAGVSPGQFVDVSGIGERFAGKMYVSGVRHTIANGNWETDVQFGLNPQLFSDTYNLRPLPAGGLLPAVNGLQIGVVTALENDPDGEDRIRVRLPLVSKSEEGAWARIATLDAGKERGTFFRPEINDEVIVGFLGDDPRHPVILGVCHSSAKPAPEPAKDSNHRKGYVSREKMRFTFDDEKKVIALETPSGNKMTFSEESKGIVIEDQNGNKITLDNSGIKIESSKELTLKAVRDIKLEGMNMDLKAQAALKSVRRRQRRDIGGQHDGEGQRYCRDPGRNGSDQLSYGAENDASSCVCHRYDCQHGDPGRSDAHPAAWRADGIDCRSSRGAHG